MKKEIGLIGLGKMGSNMAARLLEKEWNLVVYDNQKNSLKNALVKNASKARSLKELTALLPSPKIVWLMLPAGEPVEKTLFGKKSLESFLKEGDIIIDGGNSFYIDSKRRFEKLSRKDIQFIDVGVSGGPAGARHGACLMIGGEKESFDKLKLLFNDLATKNGIQFFPGAGAGHFVKMVHNGIEYGMMQAIAEGFNLLRKSDYNLDLQKVADIYNYGSVIKSRLTAWLGKAFRAHGQDLKDVSGTVGHTGEGEWTVKTAKKLGAPVKIIEESFKFRVASDKKPSYTGKILSALREQFGKHKAV